MKWYAIAFTAIALIVVGYLRLKAFDGLAGSKEGRQSRREGQD